MRALRASPGRRAPTWARSPSFRPQTSKRCCNVQAVRNDDANPHEHSETGRAAGPHRIFLCGGSSIRLFVSAACDLDLLAAGGALPAVATAARSVAPGAMDQVCGLD